MGLELQGVNFRKVVTDQNPVPVSNQGDNMAYDFKKVITPDNPLPVSMQGGSGGGATQKYNVIVGAPGGATGAINSINRVYVLPTAAAAGSVRAYVNNLRMNPNEASLAGDGVTVTLAVGATPQTGDTVYFDYEEA